ncbi:YihY/virulence factor BrkB family protein [Sphingomonas sp. HDW15A]|uniref:YihY/virulence factor BrkB family protein n=1 Tax=Sphingomonas sp. HDW15A TaxID=2714942 RepID=UPI00140DC5C8|nr:YihY/virulence factor BrkB family protein [Sphingomonas sp. HDW15A]QIK95280.1 YihY/virulence factor BrkB family protein [Sphingomonas sp. HDW15A]
MQDQHPLSPEERRKEQAAEAAALGPHVAEAHHPPPTAWEITKRVAIGVYNDGFIHAGNLAFLSLLALFPFFILAAAIAQLLGQSADGQRTVATILARLPPNVAEVLSAPIQEVLTARTGPLLWFGAIVGLWTAASFIETIRDILRRAYGVPYSAPFWTYRLGSLGIILVAVLLLMLAFGLAVLGTSIEHFVVARLPASDGLATQLGWYRFAPAVTLYATFYAIFLILTPKRYRKIGCRKWPGAMLVTLWWIASVELLPPALAMAGGYEITYGSLAGVMIALIFFFLVGLGVVTGAELNAALADYGGKALKGEVYEGPYAQQLEVEEPEPGEDVELSEQGAKA